MIYEILCVTLRGTINYRTLKKSEEAENGTRAEQQNHAFNVNLFLLYF